MTAAAAARCPPPPGRRWRPSCRAGAAVDLAGHAGHVAGRPDELVLAAVVDAELLAVHAAVHDALAGRVRARSPPTCPARWLPHCVLATERPAAAFAALHPVDRPGRGRPASAARVDAGRSAESVARQVRPSALAWEHGRCEDQCDRGAGGRRTGAGERFANRLHAVDGQPGFLSFELLRPVKGEDRYFVVTHWDTEESFQAWLQGPAMTAHSGERARPVASGLVAAGVRGRPAARRPAECDPGGVDLGSGSGRSTGATTANRSADRGQARPPAARPRSPAHPRRAGPASPVDARRGRHGPRLCPG